MKKKLLLGALGSAALGTGLYAADHGDTPQLIQQARHDGRISDHHAWHQGSDFVMSMCTNPAIPVGVASYKFAEDLTLRFHIDNRSAVDFTQPNADRPGLITDPGNVAANITLEFSFDANGNYAMVSEGLTAEQEARIRVFAGLRDDPFINGARNGRNSACIVVQMPLADVKGAGDSLLTWTTSKVPDVHGPIAEHGGRALRSQVVELLALNTLRPRAHWTELGLAPDVVIHNLGAPSGYPNGRILTDDVIDQVMDTRGKPGNPFGNATAQAPTENDKPFLADFPYLADPH